MEQQTAFLLPQAVIESNGFLNPNNVLQNDGAFATSNASAGATSFITVGNFLTNLPSDAVVTGIQFKVVAKRGAQTTPAISLQFDAVDDTSGSAISYPFTAPFTGLTTTLAEYLFGGVNYLFSTTWTVNQLNNFKLRIETNGDVSLDSVLIAVTYVVVPTPGPFVPSGGGCADCESPIQVQAMQLELPFLQGETTFYLKKGSFAYPDGTPVQPGDLGGCGGKIPFVFDEGKRKGNGQNFEENAVLDTTLGFWQVLPSGVIEVNLGVVTQRGLKFHTPGDHDPLLMSDHDANSSVIVSNNTPYNLTLVRRCQAGTVFSEPIETEDEGVNISTSTRIYNFTGQGVVAQATPNGDGTDKVNVVVPGPGGTLPPSLVFSSFATTGNAQATSLTWNHTALGVDRLLVIDVTTQENRTITGVTFDGVPLNALATSTRVAGGLRLQRFFLIAPSAGTFLINVTLSGAGFITGGARSFTGVDQTSPFDGASVVANNSGTAISENLTTTFYGSVLIDSVATSVQPVSHTQGAGQSTDFTGTSGLQRQLTGTSKLTGSAGLETNTFTIAPSTDWVYVLSAIKGITQVGGGSISVRDEGIVVDPTTVELNFVGAGVTATQTAPGEVEVNIPGGGSGGGGSQVVEVVTQTAHGFNVGEVVRIDATGQYVLAQANSAVNAEAVGYVNVVLNANSFELVTEGFVTGGVPADTPGTVYYLSSTVAGALTSTEPVNVNTVSKPLMVIQDSGNVAYFTNWRGMINSGQAPLMSLEVEDEGVSVDANVTKINFTGSGVTATQVGAGEVEVDIPGGGSGGGGGSSLKIFPLPSTSGFSPFDYFTDATLTTTDYIYNLNQSTPSGTFISLLGNPTYTITRRMRLPDGNFGRPTTFNVTFNVSGLGFAAPNLMKGAFVRDNNKIYFPIVNLAAGASQPVIGFFVVDGLTGSVLGTTNTLLTAQPFSVGPTFHRVIAYGDEIFYTNNQNVSPGTGWFSRWVFEVTGTLSIALTSTLSVVAPVNAYPGVGYKTESSGFILLGGGAEVYNFLTTSRPSTPEISNTTGSGLLGTIVIDKKVTSLVDSAVAGANSQSHGEYILITNPTVYNY